MDLIFVKAVELKYDNKKLAYIEAILTKEYAKR